MDNIDEDVKKKYIEAGRIAGEAREFGKKLIKKGTSYLEVVDKTEEKIKELGGEIAFPTNLSINEAAAHDTADVNEDRVIGSGLVKLDVGVHVDGYIGDTATTVCVDTEKEDMKKASKEALLNAIEMMTPGAKVSEISAKIEETIRGHGYVPVKNLTGHGLDKYDLHARLEFPNVKNDVKYKLRKEDVFALEPFSTDGRGMVQEGEKTLIYRWQDDKSVRSREGRKILKMGKSDFRRLPFAKRWLVNKVSKLRLNLALRQLVNRNALYEYPVLREAGSGDVAQEEHTVIVAEEPIVTTRF